MYIATGIEVATTGYATASNYKQSLPLTVLCVIVYDHSVASHSKRNIPLKNRVIQELNIRIYQLISAEDWIMDYIKKVVFPQLAFGKK
ncbi:MAG: hypothetical protein DI535_21020 [Citrobacter freundii]|nr:MAG: hypothetical protein DI535_21020 [Citrobacter freundii]